MPRARSRPARAARTIAGRAIRVGSPFQSSSSSSVEEAAGSAVAEGANAAETGHHARQHPRGASSAVARAMFGGPFEKPVARRGRTARGRSVRGLASDESGELVCAAMTCPRRTHPSARRRKTSDSQPPHSRGRADREHRGSRTKAVPEARRSPRCPPPVCRAARARRGRRAEAPSVRRCGPGVRGRQGGKTGPPSALMRAPRGCSPPAAVWTGITGVLDSPRARARATAGSLSARPSSSSGSSIARSRGCRFASRTARRPVHVKLSMLREVYAGRRNSRSPG